MHKFLKMSENLQEYSFRTVYVYPGLDHSLVLFERMTNRPLTHNLELSKRDRAVEHQER